ncbi:Receptor-like protein 19 [Bienertia sinuspersici]
MQVVGLARRASGVFRARVFSHPIIIEDASLHYLSSDCRYFRTCSAQNGSLAGACCSNGGFGSPSNFQYQNHHCSMTLTASFCSAPAAVTDPVKDVYDKILESIKVKKSAPPNAWLWSLIEKCKSRDDIKLLFNVLQQLRIFRLSNLRIHDNFNCNLCHEVTKACIRAGALDYGKKALWAHNVYGLSPTVGSANQILSYAKVQKDVKLMVDIMRLLKKNDLPLQPATADIVFSICYDADNWELISKYSRRFVMAGVKLRKTTFDVWMEFASKRGDLKSLWKIEKSRSDLYKQHTIKSGFSCAKGFLLEQKPDSAASVIQAVNQIFPDTKKQDIVDELQNLVSEWPAKVIKHRKQEDQKVLIASLKADIPAMLSSLSNLGVKSNLDNLNIAEPLPC